ncbi:hypothetical protein [Paenibacillus sp. GM2]|uniref:hypothetical protein n=1 Tax=Paenibacillus sp. GM2 TaxID=1622070 RepID=UPI000838263C|nr:hypothetical protein [Paenibacillus sp. GM2]
MKRICLILSVLLIVVSIPLTGNAAGQKQYSEEELDSILVRAGYPYLNELDYAGKDFFVKNSGENLIYTGRSVEHYKQLEDGSLEKIELPQGEIQPMATIPTSSLDVWFDSFIVYVNNVKHVDVYPSFQWKHGAVVKNDSMAVAIPDGWQIISGVNSCRTYNTTIYNYGTPYEKYDDSTQCGGRPAVENIYGMSWSNFAASTHGTAGTLVYKGTAYFRAKKTSSNAVNRFVGSYVHDTTSKFNSSYTVSLAYGAVSFSVSGGSSGGSIDTAGFSKDVSW